MRGSRSADNLLFYSFDMEEMVPKDHPLRAIKRRVDRILLSMDKDFSEAYSTNGRPSIPPERLLKALLIKALYSIASERKLEEAIHFNLLFRWFLDMNPDEAMWTSESFTKNRERFERHELFRKFFDAIVHEAIIEKAASTDHFSVDGTLIRSWASLKSLEPIEPEGEEKSDDDDDNDPGNPWVNFRGKRRTNETHRSRTDPDARLMKKGKGKEAHLSHMAHLLMENRNGLCIDVCTTEANGQAEREAAEAMVNRTWLERLVRPKTLGADAGYDDGKFLRRMESIYRVVPHVPIRRGKIKGEDLKAEARKLGRKRMMQRGYQRSQRIRKRIEEIFGWVKTNAGLARTKFRERWKLNQEMFVTASAWNLLRLIKVCPWN